MHPTGGHGGGGGAAAAVTAARPPPPPSEDADAESAIPGELPPSETSLSSSSRARGILYAKLACWARERWRRSSSIIWSASAGDLGSRRACPPLALVCTDGDAGRPPPREPGRDEPGRELDPPAPRPGRRAEVGREWPGVEALGPGVEATSMPLARDVERDIGR